MNSFPSIHKSVIIEIENGIQIPSDAHIEAGTIISMGKDSSLKIGKRVTIYPGVIIRCRKGIIEIGDDVSIGPGVNIYEMRGGLRIGNHSLIAGGVAICGVNHGFRDIDTPIREQPTQDQCVTIGKNVWIGMNTVINPGVVIGNHSIIGSGSVVTRDIPEFSVAYGSPCKRIRDRRSTDD